MRDVWYELVVELNGGVERTLCSDLDSREDAEREKLFYEDEIVGIFRIIQWEIDEHGIAYSSDVTGEGVVPLDMIGPGPSLILEVAKWEGEQLSLF